jgi:hypothetical protein
VKGNSPEAQRIRSEAEKLFKNEIIGEEAQKHQAANPGVTDAQALSYASSLKTLDDSVKMRLEAYLRKTDDRSRVQMLMGKMPVDPSGEMISLDREQIPQEIKGLWGQWNEPNVNFMKTFGLLAHHNAEMQMQHALLQDGLAKGYLWKEGDDPAKGRGLVPLGYGKHEPLDGYYGPPVLKEAFDNLHSGQVRDWMSKLSSYTNLSKTAGNVAAGWGHNFLGNAGMLFTNGNIPWALIHLVGHPFQTAAGIKKGLWVSLMRTSPTWSGAETVKPGEFNARDEAADMVRLGVFDSEYITNEGMKDIYTAMQKGAEMERQTGSAASSLQAVYGSLKKAGMKGLGGLRSGYQMMDNFWKYVNFKMELQKQQWIHEKDATPPSLEEMKREAADATNQSLTSFNRTPEVVRRTLGSEGIGRVTGAFASFPVDVSRTLFNNVYNTGREITNRDLSLKGWKPGLQSANLNARARSIAALRIAGMIGAYAVPAVALGLSKSMWKYDDKDEEAVRNTLPDDRRDNMMVMWKRDAKGNPQYIDLGWMNPYSLQNSMMRQTMRKGVGAGLSVGLQGWTKPQPALQSVIDFASNKDSGRGGRQIVNPEDPDWGHAALAVLGKARRDFAPPVVEQGVKVYKGLRGYEEPGTGKAYDPAMEAAIVASVPRRVTVDIPQTVGHTILHYKARMSNVNKVLSDKFTPKGTISPGEVEKAYTDANAQAFEVFTELRQAYKNALTLSRDPESKEEQKAVVHKALVEGLGDEIKKGGLSATIVAQVERGVFQPLTASKLTLKDMQRKRPDLFNEYNAIFRKMKPQQVEE